MKKCNDCYGTGYHEVKQPDGSYDCQDCETCNGYGTIFGTDDESESVRISEML